MHQEIHARAVEIVSRYKKAEAELIDVLLTVDKHKVYLEYGCSSLFQYVVSRLGLSESVACNLIMVARKAREVPALKEELERGTITLSNARKVAPILNCANQKEWLKKASELSHRALEREIVKVRPEAATPERVSYATPSRVHLMLGLSEKDMLALRRVQDLLSPSRRRAVSLEEALVELTQEYLRRKDPLERVKRIQVKKGFAADTAKNQASSVALQTRGRTPLNAAVVHQVHLRDGARCTHLDPSGERCRERRWLDIHHVVPVSLGGGSTVENLQTLCSAHHSWFHSKTKLG